LHSFVEADLVLPVNIALEDLFQLFDLVVLQYWNALIVILSSLEEVFL